MDADLQRRIARAKKLLSTVRHAAMATMNSDGTPHNTPFRFMYDPTLDYIYWGSHPDSLHSQNILRTGKLFVVLYDAIERGGLYIQAEAGHILESEELAKALSVHNDLRKKEGQEPLKIDYYSGTSPQRIWAATITHFWVNHSERYPDGLLIRDKRIEVTKEDLLR